jgi:PleD family two-component response regulator
MQAKGADMSGLPTDRTRAVLASAASRDRTVDPPALHILLAADDTASRELREAQLRRAGFRVSVARTGFEAIVKASCQMPDVILLDDSLSGIEAAETGRLLTTCPVTSHIPVVRLSRGRRLPPRILSQLKRAV